MNIRISQIKNACLKKVAMFANTNIKDDFIDSKELSLFTKGAEAMLANRKCTSADFYMIFGYQPSKKDIKNAESLYDIDQMKINLHDKRKLLDTMKLDRKNGTHNGRALLVYLDGEACGRGLAGAAIGAGIGVTIGFCSGVGASTAGPIGLFAGAIVGIAYGAYQQYADNSSTNQKYKKELPKLISALEKDIKNDEAILKMLTVK